MTDRVARELVLDAGPHEVWKIVTASGWLADDVELELCAGGEARFSSSGQEKTGWVEEAVAPDGEHEEARLTFWWTAADEPASRVQVTLEPVGDAATRLRIVETRPLEVLDLVGIPLPGAGGKRFGPALVAA